MAQTQEAIAAGVELALGELAAAAGLRAGSLVVFGVSTSEVLGHRIGTSGAQSVAAAIWEGAERARARIGFDWLWQCCEHLNRSLVVERAVARTRGWTEVSAVPVPKAGGSMAALAWRRMAEPCLVERAQADAGIDIGETMIGMHVRQVAVPVRPSSRWIGEARVTMAYARPKLIGGARAVYALPAEEAESSGECD